MKENCFEYCLEWCLLKVSKLDMSQKEPQLSRKFEYFSRFRSELAQLQFLGQMEAASF